MQAVFSLTYTHTCAGKGQIFLVVEPYAEFRSWIRKEKTSFFYAPGQMEVQDRFAQRPDEDNCCLKKRERRVYSVSTCASYPFTWELGVKKIGFYILRDRYVYDTVRSIFIYHGIFVLGSVFFTERWLSHDQRRFDDFAD